MARDTDRKQISEAVRLQSLWRRESFGKAYPNGSYVELVSDFDERLHVEYHPSGMLRCARYQHWDRGASVFVTDEHITTGKRNRVLHLINQGRES